MRRVGKILAACAALAAASPAAAADHLKIGVVKLGPVAMKDHGDAYAGQCHMKRD